MLASYMRRLEKTIGSVPAYVRFTAIFFAVIFILSIAILAAMLWIAELVKL